MFDFFASTYPAQDVMHLGGALRRDDDVDALADRLQCRKSEQAFGSRIPAGYGSIKSFCHNGVVGGLDGGAEDPLSLCELIPGSFGTPMLSDLKFKRDGFGLYLVQ